MKTMVVLDKQSWTVRLVKPLLSLQVAALVAWIVLPFYVMLPWWVLICQVVCLLATVAAHRRQVDRLNEELRVALKAKLHYKELEVEYPHFKATGRMYRVDGSIQYHGIDPRDGTRAFLVQTGRN